MDMNIEQSPSQTLLIALGCMNLNLDVNGENGGTPPLHFTTLHDDVPAVQLLLRFGD